MKDEMRSKTEPSLAYRMLFGTLQAPGVLDTANNVIVELIPKD